LHDEPWGLSTGEKGLTRVREQPWLTESLDRISRDQEDTAKVFKKLTFARVQIITLTEGVVNTMHVGFKGTMNAMFLLDLRAKTHRGLRGASRPASPGEGAARATASGSPAPASAGSA
jgi:DNA invertase Pin-like site-specific DNA recombinase